jgi:hypothetical protein
MQPSINKGGKPPRQLWHSIRATHPNRCKPGIQSLRGQALFQASVAQKQLGEDAQRGGQSPFSLSVQKSRSA